MKTHENTRTFLSNSGEFAKAEFKKVNPEHPLTIPESLIGHLKNGKKMAMYFEGFGIQPQHYDGLFKIEYIFDQQKSI